MPKEEKPAWLKIKPDELQSIVIELGQKNIPPEKIGLILRDEHGIPSTKVYGKKISQILKESSLEVASGEQISANNKAGILKKHITTNSQDLQAKKALTKQLWNIHKFK
jgi:small subunit ribosomal protein S15